MIYNCGKTPFEFAKAVFNRGYPELDIDTLTESTCFAIEEEPGDKIVTSALADYYRLPANLFYLFPNTRARVLQKALKDDEFFGHIVGTLNNNGYSFRKCAEILNSSYTRVYNAHNRYTHNLAMRFFEKLNDDDKDDKKPERS